MALADRKVLKQAADEVLSKNSAAAKRTVLLYSGIWTGALFAVAAGNALLGVMMEKMTQGASGLDALGTVSILETVQTVLNLATTLLPTFWMMGYVYVLLRMSAGEQTEDRMLLQGFRKFGPILRKSFLEGFLVFGLTMAASTVASTLMVFFPVSDSMSEIAMEYLNGGVLTDQQMMQVMAEMAPVLIITAVVALALVIPMLYRLRMSNYILMEMPQFGALHALIASFRMTKGSCMKLFLLEMSFLWFYLAQTLAGMLVYLGDFLPMLGVKLPFSGEISTLIFYGLGLVCQFVLQYFAVNKVEMTFVQAYRQLSRDAQLPDGPK